MFQLNTKLLDWARQVPTPNPVIAPAPTYCWSSMRDLEDLYKYKKLLLFFDYVLSTKNNSISPKFCIPMRYLKDWFFIIPCSSEWARNDNSHPEFITLLISVMNSGWELSFRAHSDEHGTLKNQSLRYLR